MTTPDFPDSPVRNIPQSPPSRKRFFPAAANILFLWFVFCIPWLWNGEFFLRFPGSILSGELFSGPFNPCRAGLALDQPTIGKYLLWFSIFSTTAAPYAWLVRKKTILTDRSQYAAFAIPLLLTAFWTLSILSWPACLLVRYVSGLGLTPMRLLVAGMITAGALGWIAWPAALLHKKGLPPFLTFVALVLLAIPACLVLYLATAPVH